MDKRLIEDFPVNWEDDHFVTRREFFRFLSLASGGLTVGTVALAAYSQLPEKTQQYEQAKICSVNDLKAGAALAFSYPQPSDLCLLIKRIDGTFVSFTRRCTHLSCPVEYEATESTERLFCPCHNGGFSLEDGHVTKGPPPRPLPEVKLEIRGDEVWAVGIHTENGE
jgi:nitrite reductase/ring-hydroxylating ferredoxin subunit